MFFKPILLTLSGLSIYTFGIFLAVSFFVFSFLVWKQARNRGLLEEKILDTVILTSITAFIGSRLGFAILNWQTFGSDFGRIVLLSKYPGMSLEVGLASAILGAVLFAFLSRLSILETLDLFSFAVAVASVFGSFGCFVSSCTIAPTHVSLISFGLSLSTAIVLWLITYFLKHSVNFAKLSRRFGLMFLSYLILLSISFLMLSIVRGDLVKTYQGPTVVLTVSLVLFIIRYPEILAMAKFPQTLLNQVKSYLETKSGDIEGRLKKLQKEDPFQDKSRLLEQADDGAEAVFKANHERVAALQRQLRMALVQTRKALTKIKIGKYGICESCGKSIETGRLAAMPTATLCLACEKKREK